MQPPEFDSRWTKYGVLPTDPIEMWAVEDSTPARTVKYTIRGWLGRTSSGAAYVVGAILYNGTWSQGHGQFVELTGRTMRRFA